MYDNLVKSLRWLANMFPEKIPAEDDTDRISNNIHLYCFEAANAIEELQRIKCPHYISNVHDRGDDSICAKYACEVKALPRWISVEKRLPDTYTPVLVTYIAYNSREPFCDMCAYIDGDGEWILSGDGRTVMRPITHWMPLPEPPQEAGDGT